MEEKNLHPQKYYEEKGLARFCKVMDGVIWTANLGILIVNGILLLLNVFGVEKDFLHPLADWEKYIFGPDAFFISMLILVLNHGHNRYYNIYMKQPVITDLGLTIDAAIKLVLLLATLLQVSRPWWFVPACQLLYFMTLLRNMNLEKTMRRLGRTDSSFYQEISQSWLPHNKMHNARMLVTACIYYLIWLDILPKLVCRVYGLQAVDTRGEAYLQLKDVSMHAFLAGFSLFWCWQVVHKVVIRRSNHLRPEAMAAREEREEKYEQQHKPG